MKTKLTITLLFVSILTFSQNFSGKAVYKTSRKSDFKISSENNQMSEQMQKELEERIKKMNQKTFVLEFDKISSTYIEEAKLDAPKPQVGGNVMVMSFGGSGNGAIFYKNVKNKTYTNQTEILGKRFLIKDSLPKYEWQLTAETKNIGQYTCYKAVYTREVDRVNITLIDGETKEVTHKETVTTTAWYSPQIPIDNGPSNYQGLPGLILEINDGTTTIVCTEINITNEQKSIVEPEKGDIVTQEEYEKISREKSKEMMERFKTRDGKGINIQIGG